METSFGEQAPFHCGVDVLLLDWVVQQKVNLIEVIKHCSLDKGAQPS